MSFNKKQKTALLIGLFLIVAALITWYSFGGEIFTKTQVLVEKNDDLLGTTYQEWKDQFILGLDYTLGFVGLSIVLTGLVVFLSRDKRLSVGN